MIRATRWYVCQECFSSMADPDQRVYILLDDDMVMDHHGDEEYEVYRLDVSRPCDGLDPSSSFDCIKLYS